MIVPILRRLHLPALMIAAMLSIVLAPAPHARATDLDPTSFHARFAAVHAPACDAPVAILAPDGTVRSSGLLSEIEGAATGTTGGLGHRILLVGDAGDVKSSRSRPAPPGTLRWAIETARLGGGGWITFAPSLQHATIRLAAKLSVPSNVTLDGACSNVTLLAAPRTTSLEITGSQNIIVSGLSFTKEAYVDTVDKTGDAIGMTDWFDRVAVLHNDFRRCGDGCVDIVRKNRLDGLSHATVAFNHFTDHNKVMLIGTLTCFKDAHEPGCDDPLAHLSDSLKLLTLVTVQGNVFDGTSQRHPKVVSNAAVQEVDNLIAFAPTTYPGGVPSATYGTASSAGGVLIAQDNIFVNTSPSRRLGAGTMMALHGADAESRTPSENREPGVARLIDNLAVGDVLLQESRPELARVDFPPVRTISPDGRPVALAECLSRLAGPDGAGLAWAGCGKD